MLDNTTNNLENEDLDEDVDVEPNWENGKRIRFLITAEIDLSEYDISEGDNPIKYLKDQFIKIKSGLYDNLASGFVTNVARLPDNTEESSS